ncbi:isochorismatase family protein [Hydrogenophaga sp. 5NK40-0174]|uniref:isochorismatase family protein n=1 Tax=Hydrogenophaga sp. 5NK40-0174 TaxID=3127649 RepID=UPI003101DFD0
MLLNAQDCQLVLVDFQPRLMKAISDGSKVQSQAVALARGARLFKVPVWGTQQAPAKLGELVPELAGECREVLSKQCFSAVAEGLGDMLREASKPAGNARSLPKHLQKRQQEQRQDRSTIVVAGCEAHICLMQTALELLEEEFDVCVVVDACGSRTERNRDAAFDRLAGAGVELVTTEMVLFEWLGSAEHPAFKDVQALVK